VAGPADAACPEGTGSAAGDVAASEGAEGPSPICVGAAVDAAGPCTASAPTERDVAGAAVSEPRFDTEPPAPVASDPPAKGGGAEPPTDPTPPASDRPSTGGDAEPAESSAATCPSATGPADVAAPADGAAPAGSAAPADGAAPSANVCPGSPPTWMLPSGVPK